jgi:shikimate kinase
MRIYLIGYMGSGKTQFGKKLSEILSYQFLDTDQMVEKNENLTVNDIFNHRGEDYFRQKEHQALLDSFSFEKSVISTGGGLPAFFDHMSLMNEKGLTIFLKANVADIATWLVDNKTDRPLIKDKSADEIKLHTFENYKIRVPYYRQAKMIINPQDMPPEILIRFIKF